MQKGGLWIVCLLMVAVVLPVVHAGNLTDGLVAYYDADGANCTAEWRYGNDLVAQGGAACTAVGLNGTNAYNISADATKFWNASLVLPTGASERTLCGWAYTIAYMNTASTVGWFGWGNATTGNFHYVGESNNGASQWRKHFLGWGGVGDYNYEVVGSSALGLNKWQFFCSAYNGSTQFLYLNGTNVANQTPSFNTGILPFQIGKGGASSVNPGSVVVDSIGIWNRSLSAEEVSSLWGSGSGCGTYNSCFNITVTDALGWSNFAKSSDKPGRNTNFTVTFTSTVSNLSSYIFSFDNGTGTFVNDTPVSLSGLTATVGVVKFVNTSVGATIRAQYFFNSTGLSNQTNILEYNTTITPNGTLNYTIMPGYASFYPNGSCTNLAENTMWLEGTTIHVISSALCGGTQNTFYGNTTDPYNLSQNLVQITQFNGWASIPQVVQNWNGSPRLVDGKYVLFMTGDSSYPPTEIYQFRSSGDFMNWTDQCGGPVSIDNNSSFGNGWMNPYLWYNGTHFEGTISEWGAPYKVHLVSSVDGCNFTNISNVVYTAADSGWVTKADGQYVLQYTNFTSYTMDWLRGNSLDNLTLQGVALNTGSLLTDTNILIIPRQLWNSFDRKFYFYFANESASPIVTNVAVDADNRSFWEAYGLSEQAPQEPEQQLSVLNGLLGYWSFDGNMYDALGMNNGTENYAGYATGVHGQGLDLTNGTWTYTYPYITNTLPSLGEYTATYWVVKKFPVMYAEAYRMINRDATVNSGFDGAIMDSAVGPERLYMMGPGALYMDAGMEVGLYEHLFVVMGWNTTDYYVRVYNASGVLVGNATMNDTNPMANNENSTFRIGNLAGNQQPSRAVYDEFGLWNRTLSDAEVQWLLFNGSPYNVTGMNAQQSPFVVDYNLTGCTQLFVSGRYELQNDVYVSNVAVLPFGGNCFTIAGGNVTIDGNGYALYLNVSTAQGQFFGIGDEAYLTLENISIFSSTNGYGSYLFYISTPNAGFNVSGSHVEIDEGYVDSSYSTLPSYIESSYVLLGGNAVVYMRNGSLSVTDSRLMCPDQASWGCLEFDSMDVSSRNSYLESPKLIELYYDFQVPSFTSVNSTLNASEYVSYYDPGSIFVFNDTTVGNAWVNASGDGFSQTCTNDGFGMCVEDFTNVSGTEVTDYLPIALTLSSIAQWDIPDVHYSFDNNVTNTTHTQDVANAYDGEFRFGSNGTALTGYAGRQGQAVFFNGSNDGDNGWQVATPTFDPTYVNGYSVAAWVKVVAFNPGYDYLFHTMAGGMQGVFAGNDIDWFLQEPPIGVSYYDVYYDLGNFTAGQWVHVVAVVEPAYNNASDLHWYVNGVEQVFTLDGSSGVINYSGINLSEEALAIGGIDCALGVVGCSGTGIEGSPTAYFDEVKYYAGVLDAGNVSALYDSYPVPPQSEWLWDWEGNSNDSIGGQYTGLSGTSYAYGGWRANASYSLVFDRYAYANATVLENATNFTFCTWLRTPDVDTSQVVFSTYDFNQDFANNLYIAGGNVYAHTWIGGYNPSPGVAITANDTHHLCVSFDAAYAMVYLDGVYVENSTTAGWSSNWRCTQAQPDDCRIGMSDQRSPGTGFIGRMDLTRLYRNKVLTAGEVAAIYASENASLPLYVEPGQYTGGASTNWSAVDAANVSYPIADVPGVVRVDWNGEGLNFSGADLNYITYGSNWVNVESSLLPPGVNTSANVTFYGAYAHPLVYADGVLCDVCMVASGNDSQVVVVVPHFTNYSVLNSTPVAFDDAETGNVTGKWGTLNGGGSVAYTSGIAHLGLRSINLTSDTSGAQYVYFTNYTTGTGVVAGLNYSFWVYDDMNTTGGMSLNRYSSIGVGTFGSNDQDGYVWYGNDLFGYNSSRYYYNTRDTFSGTDTGVVRTLGWHHFELRYEPGTKLFIIDGVLVGNDTVGQMPSSEQPLFAVSPWDSGVVFSSYLDDVEVRAPIFNGSINGCMNITESGNYTVQNDIYVTSGPHTAVVGGTACVVINTSDVVIDGNGKTLTLQDDYDTHFFWLTGNVKNAVLKNYTGLVYNGTWSEFIGSDALSDATVVVRDVVEVVNSTGSSPIDLPFTGDLSNTSVLFERVNFYGAGSEYIGVFGNNSNLTVLDSRLICESPAGAGCMQVFVGGNQTVRNSYLSTTATTGFWRHQTHAAVGTFVNNTWNASVYFYGNSFTGSVVLNDSVIGNAWVNSSGDGFSQTCVNNGFGICTQSYNVSGVAVDYLPIALNAPLVVTDMLVSYYSFNDMSDTNSTTITDAKGYNDLNRTAGHRRVPNGKIWYGITGITGWEGGPIHTGSNYTLTGVDRMTMNMWLDVDQVTMGMGFNPIVGDESEQWVFAYQANDGNFYVCGLVYGSCFSYANPGGGWHMYTLTYDGSETVLYVDGVRAANESAVGQINMTSLALGEYSGQYYRGKLDELGIWNRSLSTTEITQLYNTNNGTTFNGTDFVYPIATWYEGFVNVSARKHMNGEYLSSFCLAVNGTDKGCTTNGSLTFDDVLVNSTTGSFAYALSVNPAVRVEEEITNGSPIENSAWEMQAPKYACQGFVVSEPGYTEYEIDEVQLTLGRNAWNGSWVAAWIEGGANASLPNGTVFGGIANRSVDYTQIPGGADNAYTLDIAYTGNLPLLEVGQHYYVCFMGEQASGQLYASIKTDDYPFGSSIRSDEGVRSDYDLRNVSFNVRWPGVYSDGTRTASLTLNADEVSSVYVYDGILHSVAVNAVSTESYYWNATDTYVLPTWNETGIWPWSNRLLEVGNVSRRVMVYEDFENDVSIAWASINWYDELGVSRWQFQGGGGATVMTNMSHTGNASFMVFTSGVKLFNSSETWTDPLNATMEIWMYDDGVQTGTGYDGAFVGYGEVLRPDYNNPSNFGNSVLVGYVQNQSTYFACYGNNTNNCWYDINTMGNNATYFGNRTAGWHKVTIAYTGWSIGTGIYASVYFDEVPVVENHWRSDFWFTDMRPGVGLVQRGAVLPYFDDLVVYAGAPLRVNELSPGDYVANISYGGVSDVSAPFAVTKLSFVANIQPTGLLQYSPVNVSWDAANGGYGNVTYQVFRSFSGSNTTQNTTDVSVLDVGTEDGLVLYEVTAFDQYVAMSGGTGNFTVNFTPQVVGAVCVATMPNELDQPSQAQVPVNVTIDAPLGANGTGTVLLALGNVTAAGNCTVTIVNATVGTFVCAVPMHYWYAPGNYTLNGTFATVGNRTTSVNVGGACEYEQLLAFRRTTNYVSFPTAAPGVVNALGTPPLGVENTGNVQFNVSVKAQDLVGRAVASEKLEASYFNAGPSAVQMVKNVSVDVNMSVVPAATGNVSFWLSMPIGKLMQEYYSVVPWQVAATG